MPVTPAMPAGRAGRRGRRGRRGGGAGFGWWLKGLQGGAFLNICERD
ncbi:MAG: hypothetical protein M8350_06125 [Methanosarcinaceae archaeon]|nr:hypothetical protein [Methanosarcinaceae archaeon]